MEKVWYYTLDGSEKFGPYTDSELVKLISQDIVTENHYVWMPDISNWIRIGDSVYAFYLPEKKPAVQAGADEAGKAEQQQ